MNRRPASITIIACIYLAMGAIGFAYHLIEYRMPHPFQYDIVWIELIFLLAGVSGAYMLRGHNWARWLAFAWIAFHVLLSFFHAFSEFAIHSLLCAILTYFLFRASASRYFRAAKT